MINKQLKTPTEREHTRSSQDLAFTDINVLTTLPREAGRGSGLSTWPAGGDSPHMYLRLPATAPAPGAWKQAESLSDPKIPPPFFMFSSCYPPPPGTGSTCCPSPSPWRPCSRSCTVFRLDSRAARKATTAPRTPKPTVPTLLLGRSQPSALHHLLDSSLSTQHLSGLVRRF